MKHNIFISYRRDGGEVTARILRDSLVERGYRVFFDVESLRSGAFNTKIYSVIDECTDFILVLSPNALDRCKNSDDWVRREVEYALEKGKNVIPILLRGFEFPPELPESMAQLPYRNGLAANMEYYEAFLNKLETFLKCRKKAVSRLRELSGKAKLLILLSAALLGFLAFRIYSTYPLIQDQINLTNGVLANVSYNLTCMDLLADAQRDMLNAAEQYLLTGEEDVRASRFAVAANAFETVKEAMKEPEEQLLQWMQGSRFGPEELEYMYSSLANFQQECVDTMAYMEFVVSEECVLSQSEKLRTVELYEKYLDETLQYFAYAANQQLLPITREKYLRSLWEDTLTDLGEIPLNEKSWSRDEKALTEAQNESYANMQDILNELNGIQGNSNYALREMQADTLQQLRDAGYTEKRAEKILGYMSRDWEAELTESYLRQGHSQAEAEKLAREEAEQKSWELDVLLSLSPLLTDSVDVIWEKMTYLLDLGFYEEADECAKLYQVKMTNAGYSDRYAGGLAMFIRLMEEEVLDYGIMVMEYYEEDPVNEQLLIGDVIYSFNGQPCRSTQEYLDAKAALMEDSYTVKVLRLSEDLQVEVLELTLAADSPRVYLNNLVVPPEA